MTADSRQQFGALLEQHGGIVRKVAGTYCRHPDDRADLAQEIAAQLWHAWPKFDPARSFSTWMYRIALNVAISYVRGESRRRRRDVAFDEAIHNVGVEPVDHEVSQQVEALYSVIDRLEPLDRALLLLYLDERSHREIAEILGLSPTNVATKIGRLKQRIRHQLC